MEVTEMMSSGDARRMILETIIDLRNNRIDPARGLAIAANMKVLNDSIQVEINAAKLSIATEGKAHNFGKVVGMGQRLLGNSKNQDS
jgi:hypothetical protein